MKNFKDIILEKLKVTPNNTGEFYEFKIQTIASASPMTLSIMLRDIDFHMFNYENYINNVLDTDIVISSPDLKTELNYSKSPLRDSLSKFLNNILTIMNTSKSDHIKYGLQQFIRRINKSYTNKKLGVKIQYKNRGVGSEEYILLFHSKEYDYTTDNILILQITG